METHRIVLRLDQKSRGTTVSCVCRASEFKHHRSTGGGEYYEPIGVLESNQSIWDIYNQSENHWVEFTEKDMIRV